MRNKPSVLAQFTFCAPPAVSTRRGWQFAPTLWPAQDHGGADPSHTRLAEPNQSTQLPHQQSQSTTLRYSMCGEWWLPEKQQCGFLSWWLQKFCYIFNSFLGIKYAGYSHIHA
jgi:hypothetical protein